MVRYPTLASKVEISLACDFGHPPTITTWKIEGQPSIKPVYAAGHEFKASKISTVHRCLLIRALRLHSLTSLKSGQRTVEPSHGAGRQPMRLLMIRALEQYRGARKLSERCAVGSIIKARYACLTATVVAVALCVDAAAPFHPCPSLKRDGIRRRVRFSRMSGKRMCALSKP
jgi:hypothetical protein